MRQQTYDLLKSLTKKYYGYIRTKQLLAEGLTNRQIAKLQEEGFLQKVANGCFWMTEFDQPKPQDYKAVEVGLINKNAVIIAESACYYQGLIKDDPETLAIATRRSDRHQMHFPFPVARHYLAEESYEDGMSKVETAFGDYNIYSMERSVCDCIRFQDDMDEGVFEQVIGTYQEKYMDEARKDRMLAYARSMKFEEKARKVLQK